jgi:hypothetical protein
MQQAFLFFVNSMCLGAGAGSVTISRKDLDSLPKDMALGVGYDPKQDSFSFGPVKVEKKPLILVPDKRIVT